MRFKRYLDAAIDANNGSATTREIREWFIRKKPRWTPSVREVSNILSHHPCFARKKVEGAPVKASAIWIRVDNGKEKEILR